jgi:hypothetical protein
MNYAWDVTKQRQDKIDPEVLTKTDFQKNSERRKNYGD